MNEFLTIEHAEWMTAALEKEKLIDIEVETEIIAGILYESLTDYGVDYQTMSRVLYRALDADSSRKVINQNNVIGAFIKSD